jgi:hypothetical protein
MFGSKRPPIQARNGFLIEEIRRLPSVVNEIPAQVEVAAFLGDAVEPQKGPTRSLDARSSPGFTRFATKTIRDMVHKTLRNPKEPIFSGSLKVDYSRFDQMAGAIELV